MVIQPNFHFDSVIVSERELALYAERARIAEERAGRPAAPKATPNGALVVKPVSSH